MISIIISSDPRYNINRLAIREIVLNVLSHHRVFGKMEVGINVVGDRKMHELNKRYRGVDTTTDILSFALEDPQSKNLQHIPRVGFIAAPDKILRLGDIVISYPQAVADAALDGIQVEDEISNLVEHGIKHLLGIHHT